jgi:paraquat-inducible protein A
MEYGLCSCHVCGLVVSGLHEGETGHCPRCDAFLHLRKPGSVSRCWALLIASYILYIPANLLTIMETGTLLNYRQDTIMSGIIHLWATGSKGIATIVFIASILVPLFKLLALTLLLISVQRRSTWLPLDIYVVTILAALVQMGSLATVKAGPGAIAFGAVVVLTMFAAIYFDPRLIWDPLRKERNHDE